ncbi:MAG: hypothetical protein DCC57_02465 [Chloroflexi bacterium]|nr:MAG: hypothetical protein DCC57_02465 [Chloroflexota bacterium]
MVTCGVGTGVGVAGTGVSPGLGVAVGSGVGVAVGMGVGVKVGVGARNGRSNGSCDRSIGKPAQPPSASANTRSAPAQKTLDTARGLLPVGILIMSSLVDMEVGRDGS